jgi:hypothetical protein
MTEKRPYWEHPMFDPYTYHEVSGINQYEFFEGINRLNFAILRECHCVEEKIPCNREKFIYSFSDGSKENFNFVCFCPNPECVGWNLVEEENKIAKFVENGWMDMGSGSYESEIALYKIREDFYFITFSSYVSREPDFGDYYERNAPHLFDERDNYRDLPEEVLKRQDEEMQKRVQEEVERMERDFEAIPKGDFVDGLLVKATPEQFAEKLIEFMSVAFANTLSMLKLRIDPYEIPASMKVDDRIAFDFDSKVDPALSEAMFQALSES